MFPVRADRPVYEICKLFMELPKNRWWQRIWLTQQIWDHFLGGVKNFLYLYFCVFYLGLCTFYQSWFTPLYMGRQEIARQDGIESFLLWLESKVVLLTGWKKCNTRDSIQTNNDPTRCNVLRDSAILLLPVEREHCWLPIATGLWAWGGCGCGHGCVRLGSVV